jgi:hypothetical protein
MLPPLGSGWFLAVSCSWQVCRRGLGSSQVSREAWSAMFMIFGLVGGGFLMTISGAPADGSPKASLATPTNAFVAPWRRVVLFLAGAAQLVAISARMSPERLGVLVMPAVGAVELSSVQAARGRKGVSRCPVIQDPVRKRAERCSAWAGCSSGRAGRRAACMHCVTGRAWPARSMRS